MSDQRPVRYVKTVGRPRKISLELIAAWEKLLPLCQYMDTVAALLQISNPTWRRWLKLGEEELERMDNEDTDLCAEDKVLYVEFCLANRRGKAKGFLDDMMVIEGAALDGVWEAAKWRIEQRFRSRYGNQNHLIKELERKVVSLTTKLAEFEELAARNKGMLNVEPGSAAGGEPPSNGVAPPPGPQSGGN